eukprot:Clim_evm5s183 gene=Clim_evmTU5s183
MSGSKRLQAPGLLAWITVFVCTLCNTVAAEKMFTEAAVWNRFIEDIVKPGVSSDGSTEWDGTLSQALFHIDDAGYHIAVHEQPRNWTSVILFNSESVPGCELCKIVGSRWDSVAKVFYSTVPHAASSTAFLRIDFEAGGSGAFKREEFLRAPMLMIYRKGERKGVSINLNFAKKDLSTLILRLVGEIIKATGDSVAPQGGVSMEGIISLLIFLALVFTVAYVGYLRFDLIVGIAQNKIIWSSLTMAGIVALMGGSMWINMRKPPYTTPNELIAKQSNRQLGMEGQIVMVLYGLGTLAIIVALFVGKTSRKGLLKERLAMAIALVGFAFGFSAILAVYAHKVPGYPYRLLL